MLRRGIIFALLLAAVFLLAAGYFLLTGSFFLTRILTPWIAESAGCPMDIRRAVFQPASQTLVLRDFRLGDPNLPLLTVRRAQGRIDLWALCRGELVFDNVELRGAVLNLRRDASGKWLWDSFGGGGRSSSPVALRVGHARAEDSRIQVELKDGVRDMRWSFDGVSASAADLRNGGVMKLECCSPFRAAGRAGTDFAGEFAWNGELAFSAGLALSAIRGEASFGHFSGRLDDRAIDTGGISCVVDAARTAPDSWRFRRFRLIRQKMRTVTGMAEFSGYVRPGRYEFDVRRVLLSGQLLTFLTDLGCGVRPGDARLDWRGKIGGDRDRFTADLNCRIERQPGPAFFGGEKVELPGFRLTASQNVSFDWRTARVALREVDAELSVGGRAVAVIRKTPENGAAEVRLNGVDLDLLRFLDPAVGGFGFRGGAASGTVTLQPGTNADTLAADVKISLAGTSVGNGAWRSRPFEAEIDGRYFLPLAGGTLKIDRMRTVFSQSGKALGRIELAGSVPLRGGRSELAWKSSAVPDAALAAADAGFCRPVRAALAPFAPLMMEAEGKILFSPDRMLLKDCSMTLSGGETAFRIRTPEPVALWTTDRTAPVRSAVWEAAFPARLLPPAAGLKLTAGICRMQGRVNCFASGIALEGDVRLRKAAGQYGGRTFADLSGGMDLALQRKNDGGYVLRQGTVSLLNAGHPALRLESSGSCDVPSGAFRADIQILYANEHLTDLLQPGLVRGGQLSGSLRASGDFGRGDWAVFGSGKLEKFRLSGADSPVDGELSGEFRRRGGAADLRNGKLTLKRGGEVLANLSLSAEAPADAARPVRILFSGDKLDLRSCYEHLGGSDAAAPETPPSRRMFDFGPRPKIVRVELKNMQWGKTDGFALDGTIRLCRNRLTGENILLDLGGGRIRWDLDGMDFPTGMMLALSGRVKKPLSLTAVTALFYPDSGFSGTLAGGAWNLNFRRMFASEWGEDLVGECLLRFESLQLPVDAANGPLSRILLLPVETVVRADRLIPETLDVREHFRKLWRRSTAESPFSRLTFSRGRLHLTASDGTLQVRQMEFDGDLLEQMRAKGVVRLREPYELELESDALLCGAAAKLPIRGTLTAPQTAAWKVLARMPDSTVRHWFDVLAHPGDQPLPEVPVMSPFVRFLRDLAGYRGR